MLYLFLPLLLAAYLTFDILEAQTGKRAFGIATGASMILFGTASIVFSIPFVSVEGILYVIAGSILAIIFAQKKNDRTEKPS